MTQLFTNNAATRLASSITSGDTAFDVAAGDGALFPTITGSDFFIATLQSSTAQEIIKVTARSTDTFTIVRAQEGTTAAAFAAGDSVKLLLTAGGLGRFAPLDSPALTGTPTAPTASPLTNSTELATTEYADTADAVLKAYVDAQALVIKPASRLATAAALAANTYANGTAGLGATLTGNSVGVLTVDGQSVVLNDYMLVKNEAAGENNGLYQCTTEGTAGVAYVLTRAVEMDTTGEFVRGFVFITAGTANASTGWVCTNTSAPTIGSTAITFSQYTVGGEIILAGSGLSKTGSTLALNTGATVITEAMLLTADNTTGNVSTSKHGYAPKGPNDATKYLDGAGAYSIPAGAPSFTDDGNSGTSLTIDFSGNKTVHKVTLTGSPTFTFTAPPAGSVVVIKLVQDATGSRAVTWPAAVHWPADTAPMLTTVPSRMDVFTFLYDGTAYFGVPSGYNYTP